MAMYASNALAKRYSFALCVGNTLCNCYQLATFFTIGTRIVIIFIFFMRELCVVYVWLGQTSVNKNTTNLERLLYLCLTLDWRWSDVPLASTFTGRKKLTFFNMQKMCAEVDANYQRILTHAQRITTHWPKFFMFFCALDVRDGMCDWAFTDVGQ